MAETRLGRLRASAVQIRRRSVGVLRGGVGALFQTDSVADAWAQRDDPPSRALRAAAPVAFWVPVAAVAILPTTWLDQAGDGHQVNASYARAATTSLALGLVVSRTTKALIHRARPCTGAAPDSVFVHPVSSDAPGCARARGMSGYSSFFSEHAMAAFAIASAASFQAQRRNDPKAGLITAVGFSAATAIGVARVYQHHHWLSDVLVGAAVGTASGFVGSRLTPIPSLPARGRSTEP
jgi:membrane-associated phospholipid phosphatase